MPSPRRRSAPGSSRASPGLARLVKDALAEDRVDSDITTQHVLPERIRARALITAQQSGILAGMTPARVVARQLGLRVRFAEPDGTPVRPGMPVLELEGNAQRILAGERTLLNFLMHLSGVATLTDRVVRRVRKRAGRRPPEILATRKTLPGLRDLEKAAVVSGGGHPHRRDLASAVLIKNNHLALVPLRVAVERARAARPSGPSAGVEVEVRTLPQALTATRAGAAGLLLDNVSPESARRVVHRLAHDFGRRRPFIEVSGGITLQNVGAYARSGADALSLGILTHSVPALPFHLRLYPSGKPPRAA